MKKLLTRLSLFAFLMLPAMSMLAQSDAEFKQMIERNNKMIGEAMMAGNIDKVMAMYTEDAVQLPNNAKMLKGKSAIRMDQEEMVKEGWKVKEYNTNVQSVEAHDNVVTEIGTYSMAVQKDGMPDMVRAKVNMYAYGKNRLTAHSNYKPKSGITTRIMRQWLKAKWTKTI